jgi:hypothetical protein
MTLIEAGGVPPFGQDMNGILKQVTQSVQWKQAGGGYVYDAAFATAIGGYPAGATLNSAVMLGRQWMSLVDNNLIDPDSAAAAGWVPPPGQLPPGTPIPSFSPVVPYGYVPANGLTIGNAASNAAGRANADALFLFIAVWQQFSNAQCPLLNSAGAPIARGANPRVDFAANNQLTLPSGKGAGLIGVDGMGGVASTFLNGVPVVIGNQTTPGSILGENLHQLTTAELAVHAHANSLSDPTHAHSSNANAGGSTTGGGQFSCGASSGATINAAATGLSINNANAGSGTAHNTVHRSMAVYWNLAL